jgi:diacylglycerol kinase (ATP)
MMNEPDSRSQSETSDFAKQPAMSDYSHSQEPDANGQDKSAEHPHDLKNTPAYKNPLDGFRYALEGVIHVVRTQRHMRFHFFSVILVLMMGVLFRLDKREMLVLLFTISLVLIAEMFNSAIEAVVDLATKEQHPLAKFAKDIAAGAVLVATLNAIVVAWVLFMGDLRLEQIRLRLERSEPTIGVALTIGTILIFVIVSLVKVLTMKGKVHLFRGGTISGHSALGFFFAISVIIVSNNLMAAILAILLATLVAQSRVEKRVHSLREVVLGALLGIVLAAAIYWMIPHTG